MAGVADQPAAGVADQPAAGIADLPALCRTGQDGRPLVAVDNTLATSLLQQPLALGADVVLHSATKFVGGRSTCCWVTQLPTPAWPSGCAGAVRWPARRPARWTFLALHAPGLCASNGDSAPPVSSPGA